MEWEVSREDIEGEVGGKVPWWGEVVAVGGETGAILGGYTVCWIVPG